MQEKVVESKNIIHTRAIMDENYKIISADEDFFRYVGPTIRMMTDAVHQVDMDDFVYVVERINEFEEKSMVLRIQRYDNTYRWCLLTVSKSQVNIGGTGHINIAFSDIINQNNHYMALTRVFETDKSKFIYSGLEDYTKALEAARREIDERKSGQTHLMLFTIDRLDEVRKEYGEEFYHAMMNEMSTELVEFVGDRGMVSRYQDNGFLIMLKNVGNESNVRSFLEASRAKLCWMLASRETSLKLTFTIATSECPRNGKVYDSIEKKLFKAYEIARNKGGNSYVIYKEELHGEI